MGEIIRFQLVSNLYRLSDCKWRLIGKSIAGFRFIDSANVWLPVTSIQARAKSHVTCAEVRKQDRHTSLKENNLRTTTPIIPAALLFPHGTGILNTYGGSKLDETAFALSKFYNDSFRSFNLLWVLGHTSFIIILLVPFENFVSRTFACLFVDIIFALPPWNYDESYSDINSSSAQRDTAVYAMVDEKYGLFMCSPVEHYVCFYLFLFSL